MKYAALFRGINVGGKNIVNMNDLKQLFLDLGLFKVKTYIQSGNVVFEAQADALSLENVIHAGFAKRFEFESDILIRSFDEIGTLVDRLPFSAAEIAAAQAADPQVEHLYIYFLKDAPAQEQIDRICKSYAGPDILRMGKKELYLLCHQSIRFSKLAAQTAKVFASSTVRNLKTTAKLYDMLAAL